jgi:cytochrome c oxidase subunit III
MMALGRPDLRVVREPEEQRPAVPSVVLATILFVGAEMMMFAAFISAHAIGKANMVEWPPPGQPRLPVETTAFNTLVLLGSGVALRYAGRLFDAGRVDASFKALLGALASGLFFVGFQGVEWARLIADGLAFQGTPYGGFFYLIVGMHGLHALGGLAVLGLLVYRLRKNALALDLFQAGRLYWYFVVALWPVLYWRVYL